MAEDHNLAHLNLPFTALDAWVRTVHPAQPRINGAHTLLNGPWRELAPKLRYGIVTPIKVALDGDAQITLRHRHSEPEQSRRSNPMF
jgi:hypothetical protein